MRTKRKTGGHSAPVAVAKAAAKTRAGRFNFSEAPKAIAEAARAEGQEDVRRALATVLEAPQEESLDSLLAAVRDLRRQRSAEVLARAKGEQATARVRMVAVDVEGDEHNDDVMAALARFAEAVTR